MMAAGAVATATAVGTTAATTVATPAAELASMVDMLPIVAAASMAEAVVSMVVVVSTVVVVVSTVVVAASTAVVADMAAAVAARPSATNNRFPSNGCQVLLAAVFPAALFPVTHPQNIGTNSLPAPSSPLRPDGSDFLHRNRIIAR
jgi:hypothetical protein